MFMKKNGFTLVELLGVIVIIAVLVLVAFPVIMSQFRKNKTKISNVTKQMITEASLVYVEKNQNQYPKHNGNIYCVTLNQLVNNGNLTEPLTDPSTKEDIPLNHKVKITVENNIFYSEYVADNSCTETRAG